MVRACLHQTSKYPQENLEIKCMKFTENLDDYNSEVDFNDD